MIIRNQRLIQNGISSELIVGVISEHKRKVVRLNKLLKYYKGETAITRREVKESYKPNNKIVANHSKYITDIATSYISGNDITFTGKDSEIINEINKTLDIHSHDTELYRDLSIFGVGFELLYFNEIGELEISVASPLESFVVRDNSIKNKPLFAVRYFANYDFDGNISDYSIIVYTKNQVIEYIAESLETSTSMIKISEANHHFQSIPLVEYQNNKIRQGDAEPVLSLIDAYDKLTSNRIDDKEALVDSILLISGSSLGDTESEVSTTAQMIEKYRMLELDENGKAEYLVKSLNETEVQILANSIKQDIHEFALVPCLTDENFSVNASGVAMKYKLLGIENLCRTKEAYFKKSLRERLHIIAQALAIKGVFIDVKGIKPVFTRSLPSNELELANVVTMLRGTVSLETLLSLLPFVNDVSEEMKVLAKEQLEQAQQQQQLNSTFGFDIPINEIEVGVDEDEERAED